jgi:GTP-binding protein SAR1
LVLPAPPSPPSPLTSTPPSAGVEEFQIGNCKVKAVDLGGHETARRVWNDHAYGIDAVVYLVDATDQERFPESKRELDKLLAMEVMANVPFLILGNKIDLPTAVPEHHLRGALGLSATTGKSNYTVGKDSGVRPIEMFMCSIVKRSGYGDGFEWLMKFL